MAANRNRSNTIQPDWTETDESSPAFIRHKPTTKPVVAGENIRIEETDENFTIHSNGGGSSPEYTAGEGIEISGDTISVDTDAIQTKLTAGTNIEINSGIISTGKSVVAAGSNVSVDSSLDSLTNTVTYTVSGEPQVQSSWTESNRESPAYIQNKPYIPDEQVLVFRDYNFNRDRVKAAFDSGKIVFCDTKFSRDTNKLLRLYLTGYDQTKIDDVDYEIYWFCAVEPYYSATSVQYANAEFNMPAVVFYYNKSTGAVSQSGTTWQCKQPDWNESDPTADNYIKNKPTSPSGGGGTVNYSINRSQPLTWIESSSYASGVFYLNAGGDNSGIEYYLDNEDNIQGYQLVQGHVYQLNFNLNITHGSATGKLIQGHIYTTGPIDQNWYFQVDGSQSEDLSFTGSTLVHCSTSSTVLVFSAKIDENLNGSYPSLTFSQISIVDLTALTGAN